MKFVAGFLIILFVNKLIVHGEQTTQTSNSTAKYETLSVTETYGSATVEPLASFRVQQNSPPMEAKDYKHEERQSEEEINVEEVAIQKVSTESEASLVVSQGHNIVPISETQDKYEASSLSASNLTNDFLLSQIGLSKHKVREDNHVSSFNQSWVENRAKTIHEYLVAAASRPFNSDDSISQSSSLAESELIEIVLKEATNSNKQFEENNPSKGRGHLWTTTERLETDSATSNRPLDTTLIKSVEEFQNYTAEDSDSAEKFLKEVLNLSERPEEEAVSSKVSLVAGEEAPLLVKIAKNGLEITDATTTKFMERSVSDKGKAIASLNQTVFNGTQSLEKINNLPPVAANELSQRFLNTSSFQIYENSTAVSEQVSSLNKTQDDAYLTPSAEINTTSFPTIIHDFMPHFTETENDLREAVSQQAAIKAVSTPKPVNSLEEIQDSSVKFKEISTHDLTPKSDDATCLSSTEPLVPLSTASSSIIEPETSWATERDIAMFENQELPGNKLSFVSVEKEEEEEQEEKEESSFQPKISFEEYAVQQMNFILDHLLLETQKFVANVLQATINSVYPRDRLKHYAEGVNQVLNPLTESDYSDESSESIKSGDQEETYERVVEKLHFLKNKSSRYLLKQMPPEWLKDYQDKRAELAIWLDKAAEQMHREFIGYITAEDDPIKYQYFNETFDDISRATEIHHKLALLADLVKIIKNKKQITFMDLYMQES